VALGVCPATVADQASGINGGRVGRLAAGVAHEINTPIQHVSDNVSFLRDAMADVETLFTAYRELTELVLAGASSARTAADGVREAEQRAGLDELRQVIPDALERSIGGLERVASIVRSMKDFAHPDRKELTPVDLNRALESALTIARSEYKYVADLIYF